MGEVHRQESDRTSSDDERTSSHLILIDAQLEEELAVRVIDRQIWRYQSDL